MLGRVCRMWRVRSWVLAAMAIGLGWPCGILAGPPTTAPRPLVMAHRGGNVEADENTLKAFRIA